MDKQRRRASATGIPSFSSKRTLRRKRPLNNIPVEHVTIETPDASSVETPELLRRMDNLGKEWSTTKRVADEDSLFSLDSSASSLGISCGVSPAPLRTTASDDWTPSSSNHSSGGESVFDRLYRQGRAKLRARRSTAASSSRHGASSQISFGGTTISSQDSVHERLYRNDRKRTKQRGWSPDDEDFSSIQSTNSSWQRRINYSAPMDVRSRRLRQSRSQESPSATSASKTVFDRLYRNESRLRTQRSSQTYRIQASSPPVLISPKESIDEISGFETYASPIPLSSTSRGRIISRSGAEHPFTTTQETFDTCTSLLAKEISFLSAGRSSDEELLVEGIDRVHPEMRLLASEVALVNDTFTIGESSPDPSMLSVTPPKRRGLQEKRSVESKHITMVQSLWRGKLVGLRRAVHERAAIELQRNTRGFLVRRRQPNTNKDQLDMAYAACLIQRCWRAHMAAGQFRTLNTGFVKLQALWRMHFQRRNFLALIDSFDILSSENSTLGDGNVFDDFVFDDRSSGFRAEYAATVIQSYYRGYLGRQQSLYCVVSNNKTGREYLQLAHNGAAAVIQSAWTRRAGSIRHNTVPIQRWWKDAFQRRAEAACTIQKIWRMHSALSRFLLLHKYSSLLQAKYRQRIAGRELTRFSLAVVVLQKFSRRAMASMRQRRCTLIQRQWRKYFARRSFIIFLRQVSLIQSFTRMVLAKRGFIAKVSLIVKLQSSWRMYITQQRRRRATIAAVRIQKHWLRLSTKKAAARCIQRQYRAYIQKRKVQAVETIALWWYKVIQRRHLATSATAIQAMVRQRQQQFRLEGMLSSIRRLQSQYRMYQTRHKYLEEVRSIIRVQSAMRRCIQRKKINRIASALTIQCWWRSASARLLVGQLRSSAEIIQRTLRVWNARRRYHSIRIAIIDLQHCVRSFLIQRALCKRRNAARVIRTWLTHCYQRKQQSRLSVSATTIQANARRFMVERQCFLLQNAACSIQARSRMILVKADVAHRHRMAAKLQVQWHSYLREKRFRVICRGVVQFQAIWRAAIARERCYLLVMSTLRLQRWCKVNVGRRKACSFIQAAYRGHSTRSAFRTKLLSALLIQAAIRRFLFKKALRDRIDAAILIQSAWRCCYSRSIYIFLRGQVVVLQSSVRMLLARCKLLALIATRDSAALLLQTRYRMLLARRRYCSVRALRDAALRRQQAQRRMYLAEQRALAIKRRHNSAATLIQSKYRMLRARRTFFVNCHCREAAAMKLQCQFRMFKATRQFAIVKTQRANASLMIQAIVRSFLSKRSFILMRAERVSAVVRLQAFARMLEARQQYFCIKADRESATLRLQSLCRRWLARYGLACAIIQRNSAVNTIQGAVRRLLARRALLLRSLERKNRHARIICRFLLVTLVDKGTARFKRLARMLELRSRNSLSPRTGKYALMQLQSHRDQRLADTLTRVACFSSMPSVLAWRKALLSAKNAACAIIQRVYRRRRRLSCRVRVQVQLGQNSTPTFDSHHAQAKTFSDAERVHPLENYFNQRMTSTLYQVDSLMTTNSHSQDPNRRPSGLPKSSGGAQSQQIEREVLGPAFSKYGTLESGPAPQPELSERQRLSYRRAALFETDSHTTLNRRSHLFEPGKNVFRTRGIGLGVQYESHPSVSSSDGANFRLQDIPAICRQISEISSCSSTFGQLPDSRTGLLDSRARTTLKGNSFRPTEVAQVRGGVQESSSNQQGSLGIGMISENPLLCSKFPASVAALTRKRGTESLHPMPSKNNNDDATTSPRMITSESQEIQGTIESEVNSSSTATCGSGVDLPLPAHGLHDEVHEVEQSSCPRGKVCESESIRRATEPVAPGVGALQALEIGDPHLEESPVEGESSQPDLIEEGRWPSPIPFCSEESGLAAAKTRAAPSPNNRRVAVKVIRQIDSNRVLVEYCSVFHFTRERAVKLMQRWTRSWLPSARN